MRSSFFLLATGLLAAAAVAGACGGTVQQAPAGSGGVAGAAGTGGSAGTGGAAGSGGVAGTGGTAGTGAVGGGGAGGALNSGDCVNDADCGGGKCVELTPGGYRVCQMPVQEATQCQSPGMPGGDECCTSADCHQGKCFAFPVTPYCGGAMPMPHNVCATDGCTPGTGTPCPVGNETTGVCVPGGTWGYKVAGCLLANCVKDTDCTAEPGGRCAAIEDPCCSSPQGLFCTYPSDGCSKQSDCGPGQSCQVQFDPVRQQNVARCTPGIIGCPA